MSGNLEQAPELRLRLRLRTNPSPLQLWGHLAAPFSFYGVSGDISWDVLVERNLSLANDGWSLWGTLKLADAELRHKETGKKIEHLNTDIRWSGKKARVENVSFRAGSSLITMTADVPSVADPRATYQLRSAELNLSDLPPFPTGLSNGIKNLTAVGEIQIRDGAPLLQGFVTSPEGVFQETPYRDLKATISWTPTGISFKNLSLHLFNGTIQSDGYWVNSGTQSQRLEVASQIDSLSLKTLMEHTFPQLKKRFGGELNFHGRFSADSQKGVSLPETLTGSGEVLVRHGTIADFNLLQRMFSPEKKSPDSAKIPFRLPESLTELMAQPDTLFDTLNASLTIERERVRAEKLSLSTTGYTITGSGWVDTNGTARWNGALTLSPQVSHDLQREYRTIRYFLDGRGRLPIPFRVEGRIPSVTIRPANRALAQALGMGSSPSPGASQKSRDEKQGNEWLPDSLERLLHR